MRGIQIQDRDKCGVLSFDLADILKAIGKEAERFQWTCRNVECTGNAAPELEALAEEEKSITNAELQNLAKGISQTIDGEFVGKAEDHTVRLLILAIDSTYWEVFGAESVIGQLEKIFQKTLPVAMTDSWF